jgi:hypothetical protein
MRQRKINLISVLAAILSNICMYSLIYMGGVYINWFVCLLAVCFAVAVKIVVAILFYNDTDDYFNVPLFVNLFSFELTLPLEIMIRTSAYITTKVKAYIDNDNPAQG